MKSIVTRGGQVTLSKDLREELDIEIGMPIEINRMGSVVLIKKVDAWESAGDFLPENFESILKKIRTDEKSRLKRLGVLP